jgi:hypothetical protein
MTKQKRGVTRWHRVGGGWCSLGMGVAGHLLAVIRGLLCIASGLTLLSSDYGRARVYLEWRKRRIHPPKHAKSPQHRAGEFSNSSDGHALGDNPPHEKPQCQTVEDGLLSGLRAACGAYHRFPQHPPGISTRDSVHPATLLSHAARTFAPGCKAIRHRWVRLAPNSIIKPCQWCRHPHGIVPQEGVHCGE